MVGGPAGLLAQFEKTKQKTIKIHESRFALSVIVVVDVNVPYFPHYMAPWIIRRTFSNWCIFKPSPCIRRTAL